MSREGTVIQVNYKNGIPDLVNVYIDEPLALENTLDFLIESAGKIVEAGNALRAAQNLSPVLQHAPQVVVEQAPQAQVPVADAGGVRVVMDRYNNRWTYGLPGGGNTPRGPMILKEWTARSGKACKKWFDPAAGPEWTGDRIPSDQWVEGEWADRK